MSADLRERWAVRYQHDPVTVICYLLSGQLGRDRLACTLRRDGFSKNQ